MEKERIEKTSAKNAWGLGRDKEAHVLFSRSLSNFRAVLTTLSLEQSGFL